MVNRWAGCTPENSSKKHERGNLLFYDFSGGAANRCALARDSSEESCHLPARWGRILLLRCVLPNKGVHLPIHAKNVISKR
jgi:hypothetical protein